MKVKKLLAMSLCLSFAFSLTGCGAGGESEASTEEMTSVAEKIVVTTEAATEATTEEVTEEETTEESSSAVLPYDGDELVSKYASFEVTSSSITDGVWNDVISNSDKGSNASPELTWEPVEGATVYAIYMVDINMHYFLHWNSNGITETSLGGVNSQTLNMQDFIDSTDTDIDGNTGNIVAIGHLSGDFTND